MCRIIFASHGELSKGMKNSVSMIVGDLANEIETFSLYPGENPNDYYEELKNQVTNDNQQVIILCDIKGGSVHTALSRLTQFPNVVIISGMNLGIALDLVLQYRDGISKDCYDQLLESAKSGITIIDHLEEEADEEF